ncbi:MAG: efflux RND transporter periplasmic adaptor subunit [Rubrivivax sp.]|nr:efflux RND transporter periplasmic adaptor subunit [Rubrivivax sp.]
MKKIDLELPRTRAALAALSVALLAGLAATLSVRAADDKAAKNPAAAAASAAKASLTVTAAQPQRAELATTLVANGNVAAWQEAIVGAESNGMRLAEVRVNVGDTVRRGQVLATFAPDMVQADLAQSRAAVAEGEATLADASANAQRARELQASGALSAQQINQLLTAETTARARLQALVAAAKTQQLRLQQTQVLAPDHGVISARSATVGAVVPAGMELFRLIRQGRLEWRAEVPASELAQIKPGLVAQVTAASGVAVQGRVRMVAPTVDAATRNGLVYVDLPAAVASVATSPIKAGMFARGEFELGRSPALTLPQSAVLLRDGFSYVFKLGADNRVAQAKVSVGRRVGDRIEILQGLDPTARVVASGAGFLADGDTVRVVESPAAPPPVPAAKTAAVK